MNTPLSIDSMTNQFNVKNLSFSLQRPNRPEVKAELLLLNGMIYIWLGNSDAKPLGNLQIAYPSTVKK